MDPALPPIIGITADVVEPKAGSVRAMAALSYANAVRAGGGMPVILPPIVALIPDQLRLCRGFVFTGGDDPRTEPFGVPTHPKATPLHPQRQEYETALLRAINERSSVPALGVCLGMQMMALTRGGRLDQHMPDNVPTHAQHAGNALHAVGLAAGSRVLKQAGTVTSHHRQAVSDAGALRVIARAPDGVIEAIDDPGRAFYLGVQWHPERTEDAALGIDVFRSLVKACSAG